MIKRSSTEAPAASPVTITPLNVERDVIYGMYSGFALLMDVHRPVRANGYGIVFVAEWGVLTQLATASLATARPPLSVFVGASLAMISVS